MSLKLGTNSMALIRKAQQGHAESLGQLSEQVREMLTVYLYRITLDHDLAQDLCQETMLDLIKYLPKLTLVRPRSLQTWLLKSATSKVHKYFRRKRPQRLADKGVTENLVATEENPGLERLVQEELTQTISQAMRQLKPAHRTILTLRCYEELPYKDIVSIMGGTELQAKMSFFRAKGHLKRLLHRGGFDPSYLLPALGAFATLTAGTRSKVAAAVPPAVVEVTTSTAVVSNLAHYGALTLVALLTVGSVHWAIRDPSPRHYQIGDRVQSTRAISNIDPALQADIEARIALLTDYYAYINVGIIQHAQLVFVQSYGQRPDVGYVGLYASIAKTVTALLCLQLLEEGQLSSLDAPVADFLWDFQNTQPPAYTDTPVTVRHLLNHSSGLPIGAPYVPPVKGSHLDLAFRPGSQMRYSNLGYATLGRVLEAITQDSYEQLLHQRIANPLRLNTLGGHPAVDAPAWRVYSTIEDLGHLMIAVLQGKLVSLSLLHEEAFKPHTGGYGLGWKPKHFGTRDLTVEHAGYGQERAAYVILRPRTNNGVVLLVRRMTGEAAPEIKPLVYDLFALLAKTEEP